jgi:hypothetical protein
MIIILEAKRPGEVSYEIENKAKGHSRLSLLEVRTSHDNLRLCTDRQSPEFTV